MSDFTAQNGDTVSVHYLGKFPGGKVFDTSMRSEAEKAGLFSPARDYKPLQVVLGRHQVISGFEEALKGMKVNEIPTLFTVETFCKLVIRAKTAQPASAPPTA